MKKKSEEVKSLEARVLEYKRMRTRTIMSVKTKFLISIRRCKDAKYNSGETFYVEKVEFNVGRYYNDLHISMTSDRTVAKLHTAEEAVEAQKVIPFPTEVTW